MAFRAYKEVVNLPSQLEPDAVYFVRVGNGFDLYVSDATGAMAHKVNAGDLMALDVLADQPQRPTAGHASLYPRRRAGYDFLEMFRDKGRALTMQPHIGQHRVGSWIPNGGSLGNIGLNAASVGALSAPVSQSGSLALAALRWRTVSAATAGQAAEYRATHMNLWRGNAPGMGGFLTMFRVGFPGLVAGANGFFGLTSTGNLVNPMDITTWGGQFVGMGFKEGVHANLQLVAGPGTGANVLTDLGPDFPVAGPPNFYTLYMACAPNAGSIFARVVNEGTGKSADYELTSGIPAQNMFLAPRVHLDNGATAAAVTLDCYGVYVESDY